MPRPYNARFGVDGKTLGDSARARTFSGSRCLHRGPADSTTDGEKKELQASALALGLRPRFLNVVNRDEIETGRAFS